MPKQKDPASVLLTDAGVEALLEALLMMECLFPVVQVTARETGHLVDASRQLRRSGVAMESKTSRWGAEHEKSRLRARDACSRRFK